MEFGEYYIGDRYPADFPQWMADAVAHVKWYENGRYVVDLEKHSMSSDDD